MYVYHGHTDYNSKTLKNMTNENQRKKVNVPLSRLIYHKKNSLFSRTASKHYAYK